MQTRTKLKVVLVLCFVVAVISLILAGTYSFFKKAPAFIQQSLATQGIQLEYEGAEAKWTSLVLNNIAIKGNTLPYDIRAEKFALQIGLGLSWPFAILSARLDSPAFAEKPAPQHTQKSPTASVEPTAPIPKLAAFALGLIQLKFETKNLSFPKYGIKNLEFSVKTQRIGVDAQGALTSSLSHVASLNEINSESLWFSLLQGAQWQGATQIGPNLINAQDHKIQLGPLMLTLAAHYHPKQRTWNAQLAASADDLKSKQVSAALPGYLKEISGPLDLELTAQGLLDSPKEIIVEGSVQSTALRATLAHPQLRGQTLLNISAEFSKKPDLKFSVKGAADLSNCELSHQDLFQKTTGTPLKFDIDASGDDKQLAITAANAKFHTLSVAASGSMDTSPQGKASLKASIPEIDLAGYEKFFPKYSSIKTKGKLAATLAYNGPVKDWKQAAVQLDVTGNELQVPILSAWVPNPDLSLEGLLLAKTRTSLLMGGGKIARLSSQTQINLTDTTIGYQKLFHKKPGVKLLAEMDVTSANNRAQIKQVSLALGKLKGQATGSIDNFSNPSANIRFNIATFNMEDLFSFVPDQSLFAAYQIKGQLGATGSVQGPLLSKTGPPSYSAQLQLTGLSGEYKLESGKAIVLRSFSGNLAATNKSLGGAHLTAHFPNSDLSGAFTIHSFNPVVGSAQLTSNRISLSDFYESSNGPKGVGLAPVPAGNDFRKNPLLKDAQFSLSANAKSADLSGTKIENLDAKITYDKLLLTVDRFNLKAMGGSFSTTATWDGRKEVPITNQKISVNNVDADAFLSSYSDKASNVLSGRLFTNLSIHFSGMKADDIQRSVSGKGDFLLNGGKLKSIRFTKGPLESLKSNALLSKGITKTDWEEGFSDVKGTFALENGTLKLSNLIFRSPLFELVANQTTVHPNMAMESVAVLYPSAQLTSPTAAEVLKDEQGKPSLPLTISGTLKSPKIGVPMEVVEGRLKAYAQRQLEEEKKRALSSATEKAKNSVGKTIKEKLKGIFK